MNRTPMTRVAHVAIAMTLGFALVGVQAQQDVRGARRDNAQESSVVNYSGNDIKGIETIVDEIQRAGQRWRRQANERIDQFRKANLEIRVVDADQGCGIIRPGTQQPFEGSPGRELTRIPGEKPCAAAPPDLPVGVPVRLALTRR